MAGSFTSPAPGTSERVVAGTTVVAVCDDLDLVSAAPLSARLDLLTAGPRPDVVIDLRAVEFIDCSGLGVLCRARNRALQRRGRLRLVADSARLPDLLDRVGLQGVFDVLARLPEVLGAGQAPPPGTHGTDTPG
ncbi:STAS domain-containing protein [Streptomyces sp. MS06]|uniref:STAS domain-containing protein n=1 Tax=Streptomyces sp. MS06 TaxID=3385974 RepID=UPI0039A22808